MLLLNIGASMVGELKLAIKQRPQLLLEEWRAIRPQS